MLRENGQFNAAKIICELLTHHIITLNVIINCVLLQTIQLPSFIQICIVVCTLQ